MNNCQLLIIKSPTFTLAVFHSDVWPPWHFHHYEAHYKAYTQ